MTIFLHFGTHKTGSTSIQNALYHGELDSNHQYISFGRENSSLIFRRIYRSGFVPTNDAGKPLSESAIGKLRKRARTRLISTLNELPENVNGIISAEGISLLQTEELEVMRQDIVEACNHNLIAVGYIRPPEDYANSVVQEVLKHKFVPLEDMSVNFHYRQTIGKFNRVFGRKATKLWLFERDKLVEKDAVADFCHRLGCNLQRKDSQNTNKSLSLGAVRLLYAYRRKYETSKKVEEVLIPTLAEYNGKKFKMSARLVGHMAKWTEADFEWLKENHNIDLSNHWPPKGYGVDNEEQLLRIPHSVRDWACERMELKGTKKSLKDPSTIADAIHEFLNRPNT